MHFILPVTHDYLAILLNTGPNKKNIVRLQLPDNEPQISVINLCVIFNKSKSPIGDFLAKQGTSIKYILLVSIVFANKYHMVSHKNHPDIINCKLGKNCI